MCNELLQQELNVVRVVSFSSFEQEFIFSLIFTKKEKKGTRTLPLNKRGRGEK